jgi:alkylation response protein AidB-like acyl-CoA dehydrogenase
MVSATYLPTGLSEEHLMMRDAVREFAQREIVPIAAEFDESGEFPLDTIRKMGEMGLMGIEVPEQFGGRHGYHAYVLALIEIARADAAHGTVMAVNGSLIGYALLKYGTEDRYANT